MQATEDELSVKIGSLREAERTLADKQAELAKLTTDLDERSVHCRQPAHRGRRAAHPGRGAEGPRQRLRDAKRARSATGSTASARSAGAATAELDDERGKVEKLGDRVGQLERALVAQTTEAEILGRRVQELEGRLADQMKVLAEREFEIAPAARASSPPRQKTEADLRAELAGAAKPQPLRDREPAERKGS